MKDRFCLEDWPVEWVAAAFADSPKLGREAKLFLAKTIKLAAVLSLKSRKD